VYENGVLLQTAALAALVNVGAGCTVIVKVWAVPEQVLAVGVTLIVATTAEVVTLVAVNEPIFPVPLAASPIEVVLLLHV
jgi:hypothetical protein